MTILRDIYCHPEFISGSYYSQRFTKYCQNRFFGRCPQNDKNDLVILSGSEVSVLQSKSTIVHGYVFGFSLSE